MRRDGAAERLEKDHAKHRGNHRDLMSSATQAPKPTMKGGGIIMKTHTTVDTQMGLVVRPSLKGN